MSVLVIVATFLAAAVEWVEALTIVLAVGLFKGWRSAFVGTAAGILILAAITVVFGVAITSHVNVGLARTLVGVFLLLFGLKWLHKAILRSSGLKALHDEAKAFEETRDMLASSGVARGSAIDRVGVTTALSGVFLEGLEVVFIVVALGGLHSLPEASVGAGASLVVVIAAGLVFRRPLTQVPENTMKYVVGIMLTSFGTFFAGEGIGIEWWQSDLSLIPLIAAYSVGSVGAVWLLRHPGGAGLELRALRSVRSAFLEVWGLFVDDGALAIGTIAVLLGMAVFLDHVNGERQLGGALLVLGVFIALAMGLSGAIKQSWARTRSAEAVAVVEAVLADQESPLPTQATPLSR